MFKNLPLSKVLVCLALLCLFILGRELWVIYKTHPLQKNVNFTEGQTPDFHDFAKDGLAILEEPQPFENLIKDLMLIAKNDVIDNFGVHKVDMAGRKKYFTDNGWIAYQVYVEEAHEYLKKHGARITPHFEHGTQKYKENESGVTKFSASADLEYCSLDICDNAGDRMPVQIEFSGNIKDPNQIKIDKWHTEFQLNPYR